MCIKDFVNCAIEQDKTNVFATANNVGDIPEELQEFYREANPLDVEISMDGNGVRFHSLNDLRELQTEYVLPDGRFIFATCNSDPIYLYRGKIYTCYHGSAEVKDELMADNFESFLEMII
jgi:hypothetical protein